MKMKYLFIAVFTIYGLIAEAADTTFTVLTSDSVQLFVHCKGKGVPVLFIHGGPGSNSAYFEYTGGNVLEKDAMMVYLDQRGCGRSSNAPGKNYSLDRMIRDFEEVRVALGIKQWILMPHSFGGLMATAYAAKHPEAIRAMVYVCSTVSVDSSATDGIAKAIELLAAKGKVYPELKSDSLPLLNRWGMAFQKLREEDYFYPLMFATKKGFDYHDSVTWAHSKSFDFGNEVWGYKEYFANFIPVTATIKCPVLVIGGTKDYTIGVRHPKLMRFPNMQIKYVEGGHAIYFENTDAFYKAVSPFLKKFKSER